MIAIKRQTEKVYGRECVGGDCDCGSDAPGKTLQLYECVGGDCDCGTDAPGKNLQLFECLGGDCDCPTDAPGKTLFWNVDSNPALRFALQPGTILGSVNAEWAFIAHPLAAGPVAVVDTATARLLDAWRTPQTIAELSATCPPGVVEVDVRQVFERLIRLGFMAPAQPDGQPLRLAPPTSSRLACWLHLTNDCNLACRYCYVRKSKNRMSAETGYAAIAAGLRAAQRHAFRSLEFKYAGGEPTLVFPLVQQLHTHALHLGEQSGIPISGVLLTNGTNLSPAMVAEIQALGLGVSISLDGVGPANDLPRRSRSGGAAFEQVSRGLDLLAAAGLRPNVTVVVSSLNLDHLPETVAFLLARRLPFNLSYCRENDAGAPGLAAPAEHFISRLQEVAALLEAELLCSPQWGFTPLDPLHGFRPASALLDRGHLNWAHATPCGAGRNYLVIDYNGNLSRCQMEMASVTGSVYDEDPLAGIRQASGPFQNVSVDDKAGCQDCQWRYWCAGGCPSHTLRLSGRSDVQSPNCRIYQAIFPLALRLEAIQTLKQAGCRVGAAS